MYDAALTRSLRNRFTVIINEWFKNQMDAKKVEEHKMASQTGKNVNARTQHLKS